MKKFLPFTALLLLAGLTVSAAPFYRQEATLIPISNNLYDLGTSTKAWRDLFVHNVLVSTTTAGCAQFSAGGVVYSTGVNCGSGSGGVGTSTNPFMATYFVATSTSASSTLPLIETTQGNGNWIGTFDGREGSYYLDHGNLNGLTSDDHTQYILANGTRNLTGDWGVGGFALSGLTTLDTGQGANELYDMDQNVMTSNSPTFAGLFLNGNLGISTTSPWAKLSVEGTSSLGNQAIAGFFTGTSTATSTFGGEITATALSARDSKVEILPEAGGTLTISTDNGALNTAWLQLTPTVLTSTDNTNWNFNFDASENYFQNGVQNRFDAPLHTFNNSVQLTGYTSNGFIKTINGDGTLSIDTNSYLKTSDRDWELFTNTFSQSALRPTTTQNIHISGVGTSTNEGGFESWRQIASPYFHATSSTATSTFAGHIHLPKTTGTSTISHNLKVNGVLEMSRPSDGAVVVGNSSTRATGGVAVGISARSGASGVAVGTSVTAGVSALGFGTSVTASGAQAIGVGSNVTASDVGAIGVGSSVGALGNGSVAIGANVVSSAAGASGFGSGVLNGIANSTMIGPSDAAKLTILGATGSIGNVGVATTSPYSRLTVWGAGTGNGQIFELANNASTTLARFSDNGTGYFLGNIGIGTTSPWAKLSVEGTSSLGNQAIAGFFSATNTAATSTFAGAAKFGASPTNPLPIIFEQCNTTFVFGTTSACLTLGQSRLQDNQFGFDILPDKSQTGMMRITNESLTLNTSAKGITFQAQPQDNTGTVILENFLAGAVGMGAWGDPIIFTNDRTEHSRFTSAGRFSLGETSPGSKLTVSGNGTIGASYDTLAAPTNGFLIEGDTGVGTTSPTKKFSVGGEGWFSATSTSYGMNVLGTGNATGTTYIHSKTAGAGGQIILEDVGGGACTRITTKAGVISGTVVTCPSENY